MSQFDGDQGIQFQTACAEFCRNQSDAMKFLQKRALLKDEFTIFLQVKLNIITLFLNEFLIYFKQCESHTVCRKLQLADFLLNEAQRLPKYGLLFDLLVKKSESNMIY